MEDRSRLRVDRQSERTPVLGRFRLENATLRRDLDVREPVRRELVSDLLLGYRPIPGINLPDKLLAALMDAAPTTTKLLITAARNNLFIDASSVLS